MAYPHDNLPLLEAKDRYDAIDIALYDFLQKLQDDVSGAFDHRDDELALEAFSDQWARVLHNELLFPREDNLLFLTARFHRGDVVLERRWMGALQSSPDVLRFRFKVLRSEAFTETCESVQALGELVKLLYPHQILSSEAYQQWHAERPEPPTTIDFDAKRVDEVLNGTAYSPIEESRLGFYLACALSPLVGKSTFDHPHTVGQLHFRGKSCVSEQVTIHLPGMAQVYPERFQNPSHF